MHLPCTIYHILRFVFTNVDAIDTKQCAEQMTWWIGRKVDDAHERMTVFDTKPFIKIMDGGYFDEVDLQCHKRVLPIICEPAAVADISTQF